jgi:FkbM family methyltransferase
MSWRGALKRILHELRPGKCKWFWYYGCKVYFPKGSIIFRMACDQGIYESRVIQLIDRLLAPKSTYFDIGANIGLLALPALYNRPDCQVISVEPSPTSLAFLEKTCEESSYSGRWTIIRKAVSAERGKSKFYEACVEQGALSGLLDTGRGGEKRPVTVEVTTIDDIWFDLGSPSVAVIKIDIEGGELDALNGAARCISAMRPAIILEWSRPNLLAYGIPDDAILAVASRHGYEIFSVPSYALVRSPTEMTLRMLETETFVLMPCTEEKAAIC